MPSKYNWMVKSDSEKVQKAIKYVVFVSKHHANERNEIRNIARRIPTEINDIKIVQKQLEQLRKELNKIADDHKIKEKSKDLAFAMNGSANNPKEEVCEIWMKMYRDRLL